MTNRLMLRGAVALAALVLLVFLDSVRHPAVAQWVTRSAEDILAQFVQERGSPQGRATSEIIGVFSEPEKYPRQKVEMLIDGLERLALTAADPPVRSSAASTLGIAGWRGERPPRPGVVARQVRIYQSTSDPNVRKAVVFSLTLAAETRPAAAFLRNIVLQSSRTGDFPNAPIEAIRALSRLGDDGPATLRELHRSGQVRDREALGFLEHLSRTGYRPR